MNLYYAEHGGHGHGHGHGHSHAPAVPPTDSMTEPSDAMAMEVTGTTRKSFSIAAEEYSLGDIVRVIRRHNGCLADFDDGGGCGCSMQCTTTLVSPLL